MSADARELESTARCPICAGRCDDLFEKLGFEITRCRECGLGGVRPMPSPQQLSEFYANTYYDANSEIGYHSEYGELESGLKKMYRGFLDRIERQNPGRRFDSVLDVGCAYGFFLDVAEERWRPSRVVGIDVTPEAEVRNRAKGRTFHAGFFEDVEFDDGQFDFVFMGDVLEHVHDPVSVVDKLTRVLTPDGIVLLTTVDFGSWLARALGVRWRLLAPPEHLFFWTRAAVRRLFTDHGFSAEIGNYWLYYPKSYVYQRTRAQFGFTPRVLALLPSKLIPIPSFDALVGVFHKREAARPGVR